MDSKPRRLLSIVPVSLRVVLVACAAGVLLFLATQKGALALARPQFCAGCHVMQTQYVSFLRSPHHRATCVDCHAGQRCGACHAPWEADAGLQAKKVNVLEVSLHATHSIQQGIACASCHRDIMHARLDGRNMSDLSRTCGSCHKQTDSALRALYRGQTVQSGMERL